MAPLYHSMLLINPFVLSVIFCVCFVLCVLCGVTLSFYFLMGNNNNNNNNNMVIMIITAFIQT